MKKRLPIVAIAVAALSLGACGGSGDGGITSGRSAVIDATPMIEAQGAAASVTVDLSTVGNVHALVNTGSSVSGGGLDGSGNAYSETLTGTSITWGSLTFALGVAGTANGVSSTTLTLPSGNYSNLALLAAGVNGNQANQIFVVNYTDGSSTRIVQSLSDWRTPQKFAGESTVLTMAYRIRMSGATDTGPYYVYGYSLAIDGTKTVRSVTLPGNRSVVVIAIDLVPAVPVGPPPVSVSLTAAANVHGLVNTGSPVSGGGIDGSGYAYSETLTGSSISWGGATFTLGIPGTANAVSNAVVALPAGNYAKIEWLATGVNGNQANQSFVVNYTDGTSTRIVQSLSDWRTSQGYTGESKVLTMAYRVATSGATDAGPYYLYGYSSLIDGTKTVQSMTLPGNRNVVMLALDLFPAGPPPPMASSPTMSPPPGSYSTAQTVALADTTPGAAIYFTTDGTSPTTASARYSVPLPVNATTTIEAMAAASGYSNSAVVSGTYTITGAAPVSVNLSAVANVHGLVNNGSPVSGGGLDGSGHAYSESLTGNSISWSGVTFALGVAGTANAASNVTLALPPGAYSSLKLLGAAVNGNQANQTFTVNYTDGSSTKFVQSLSDWRTPQHYAGESTVLRMAYRLTTGGAQDTGPYYIYGYSFSIDGTRTIQSVTLPANRNVVVLAVTLIPALSSNLCDPLSFGAVGDGTTDNTAAIQNAVNACASQGGGIVELRKVGNLATYLTGPFTLKSHIHLQLDAGVTLQGIHDHSRYAAAFINWVYQPNEALISAKGATDVGVIGAGTVDGAGNQLQPNSGASWWTLAQTFATNNTGPPNSFGVTYYLNPSDVPTSNGMPRPWLVEFYQCDHVTVSGVTLQNSPMWTLVLRFSNTVTVSGVSISALSGSPNTDGVDVVGSSNVALSTLNISVGDDNIAIKSGLPLNPASPKQVGLPQMATSQVQVTDIIAGNGDGIVFGSEASNGVNNVTIQRVTYTYTSYGIRIKSGRDRGGQIYKITAEDLTMNGVMLPLSISDYYPGSTGTSGEAAKPITATTPYVHDITIQNVNATGAAMQSLIVGLPESCIHNVTLNKVSIQTSSLGMLLRHMTGTFTDATSNLPFKVEENVTVATAGTTPTILATQPKTGQVACSAQVVPGG
jgi:polygalacturonase